MNKKFERCCSFLAEMMEKHGALLLRWSKTASGQKGCIGSRHPVDNML